MPARRVLNCIRGLRFHAILKQNTGNAAVETHKDLLLLWQSRPRLASFQTFYIALWRLVDFVHCLFNSMVNVNETRGRETVSLTNDDEIQASPDNVVSTIPTPYDYSTNSTIKNFQNAFKPESAVVQEILDNVRCGVLALKNVKKDGESQWLICEWNLPEDIFKNTWILLNVLCCCCWFSSQMSDGKGATRCVWQGVVQ
ncbi:Tubulin gamma chain like [Actinidia chinensis var. chinensis]|uniref:Tubulin gamma chain like n=1 Tax=Actinidia chinensis var. chinensis TaxID=1590841 RepID=A0A2R6PA43_ACTCC|nr:Tubulin gamma chain like [Actinidia chinensis var. chinensis]